MWLSQVDSRNVNGRRGTRTQAISLRSVLQATAFIVPDRLRTRHHKAGNTLHSQHLTRSRSSLLGGDLLLCATADSDLSCLINPVYVSVVPANGGEIHGKTVKSYVAINPRF